jgi:hypothetical protein
LALNKSKTCAIKGCDGVEYSKGYCRKHNRQLFLYGKILPLTIRDTNEIILKENHAEIVLRNIKNKETGRCLIDLEDVEKCKQYKWRMSKDQYVGNHKVKSIHKFLLDVPDPKMVVDHINHNTLDNRKENLRKCSCSENSRNQISKTGTSKYKGVSWHKNDKKWVASIGYKWKTYRLGCFVNEEDAAIAYNKKAKELFGKFAFLNVVKPKLKLRR